MIRIPIAADGWRFILPLLVVGLGLVWVRQNWSVSLAGILFLAAAFCAFFFRDFNRVTPKDPAAVYSPGDGKILEVSHFPDGKLLIRIFLSVLDGHVQRVPVEGRIEKIVYKKGTFLDARDPQAHVQNEQNTITLSTPRGSVEVSQIAGLIARRIVCWVKEGDLLSQGERYGLIRFGSQVDVILPAGTEPSVAVGEKVWGGLTVLAKWKTS